MNALIIKLKNGEFFQFENFRDFSIGDNGALLTVVCSEGLCNYFSMDFVSYVIQSYSIPEEKITKLKETECLCSVCNGRGFVQGNFCDMPGNNVSFGDYFANGLKTTVCRNCNGNGIIKNGG